MKQNKLKIIDALILVSIVVLICNAVVSCGDASCSVFMDKIKYFPWTDYSENLVGGVNISRGDKFGYDFSQPHFPGIYLYLGIIFKIFGVNGIDPSNLLAYLTVVLSSISLMVLVLYVYNTVYGAKSLFILAVIIFSTLHLNTTYIMSETVAFWLCIPLVTTIVRYLESGEFSVNILTLPLLITFSGLGFFGIFVFPYLAVLYREKKHLLNFLIRNKVAVSRMFALLLGMLGLMFWGIYNLQSLYYWSIEINRLIKPEFIQNIILSARNFVFDGDFGNRLVNIFAVFVCIIIFRVKKRIGNASAVFLTILSISLVWRVSVGYKALPLISIIVGLILFLNKTAEESECKGKLVKRVGLLLVFLIPAVILFVKNTQKLNSHQESYSYYSDKDLCRVDSATECLCVQVMVFGPQAYLFNDIKQCKNQMNTWADRLGTSQKYLHIIGKSIEKKEGAYLIPPPEYTKDDEVLVQLINKIKASYECNYKENNFMLCKGLK